MKPTIRPCERKAAEFAVRHWHYSGTMPRSRLACYGVWEDGRFVGAVIFGRGATPNIGKPYGLDQTEICELTRIALRDHIAPVSQIVAESVRILGRKSPGLRLIVSFADTAHGHHGGIYQAGNWIYAGASVDARIRMNGRIYHRRTLHRGDGRPRQSIPWIRANIDPNAETVADLPKYRYLLPLDRAMRRQIEKIRQPYPSAVEGSEVSRSAPGAEVSVRSRPTALGRTA